MRRFTCNDLFTFNAVNLDYFTETVNRLGTGCCCQSLSGCSCTAKAESECVIVQYNLSFYLQYLARWPEYCLVAEGPDQQCMGYILGKAEGELEGWHGHVTAVTVAPESRCGAGSVWEIM